MFEKVKLNVLIPLEYNREDFGKTLEEDYQVSGGELRQLEQNTNCGEWFHYCFKRNNINRQRQMKNSPLVSNGDYQMSRMRMNNERRQSVGLQSRNCRYMLRNKIPCRIGDIRLLFTKSRVAFLHIEVLAEGISKEDTRSLISFFSDIYTMPAWNYNNGDEVNTVLFKDVVKNIIRLQNYVTLSVYGNSVETYIQITLIGSFDGNEEEKMRYFNSVQGLLKFPATACIKQDRIYLGEVNYILRFAGDRTVCIYGDTGICGESNMDFVRNGLIATATENYTIAYAFLISLWLIALNRDLSDPDREYLKNAPKRCTNEPNINIFYEVCLWKTGWNLDEYLQNYIEDVYRQEQIKKGEEQDHALKQSVEDVRKAIEDHDSAMKESIQDMSQKVNFIVDFVNGDLKTFLALEKKEFEQSCKGLSLKKEDEQISRFTEQAADHIGKEVEKFNKDDSYRREEKNLEDLFGEKWNQLMLTSRLSLVSSGILLRNCAEFNDVNFDFSGVCICATAALEAELKRIFFTGLLEFMVAKYGMPCNENADHIYENWPEELLTVARRYFKPKKDKLKMIGEKKFTMGKLPFLFGENRSLSDDEGIRSIQEKQSTMMQARMNEYLKEIVDDDNPLELFYINAGQDNSITSQKGCFVWKCEQIRNDYRNKAAHVPPMGKVEAVKCCQSVIGIGEMYGLTAEITGVILELFKKVNINKLNELKKRLPSIECVVQLESERKAMPEGFHKEDVVELTDLEWKTNKLRGKIKGSAYKGSLSTKHVKELRDRGILVKQYLGKEIKVRIKDWTGEIFNVAWEGGE